MEKSKNKCKISSKKGALTHCSTPHATTYTLFAEIHLKNKKS